MNRWFRVAFEHAITHAVPEQLFDALVDDMIARDHPLKNYEQTYGREQAKSLGDNPGAITEWAIDCGGCVQVKMPKLVIDIDGLAIDVWVDQFDIVIAHLAAQRVRRFVNGEAYFKLKPWLHATVFTPLHLLTLQQEMALMRDDAKRLHVEFKRNEEVWLLTRSRVDS